MMKCMQTIRYDLIMSLDSVLPVWGVAAAGVAEKYAGCTVRLVTRDNVIVSHFFYISKCGFVYDESNPHC